MKINHNDQALISAIAAREPASAALLYDQYAGKLYKVICCSINDPQMAAAVLEETMLFIWNNCKQCGQDKRLLLWMAGVARQMARKRVERQRLKN